MSEWWASLSIELKIYYGVGIISLVVVVIQLLLSLIGFDSDSAVDVDIGDIDHSTGIGLFSSQTISAFFLGFGWSGVAAISYGASVFSSVVTALAFGVGTMFAMFYLILGLLSLQSKGNLDYRNAVGKEATVYVTIPGSDKGGGGQIEVVIQGRNRTALARKKSPGSLKPGQRVRIVGLSGQNTFIVEPL